MRSIRLGSIVSILAMAGTFAFVAHAQEQEKAAAPTSGIFVETAGGQQEVKLPSTRFDTKATGLGKSMATMGFTKPQMEGELAGPKAYTRLASNATFRVQLEPQSGGSAQNMSPEAMMGMMGTMFGGDGSIPPMARNPQDFALVKLTVADEARQAHFGAAGASRPKNAVDVAVDILGPNAFRVKPKRPLEPGEYAFYVRMGNSPMGPAWDFGVDGK